MTDAPVKKPRLRKDATTTSCQSCEALRFEKAAYLAALDAKIKGLHEAERVLGLIRMRLPFWAWRWLTRNPR